MLLDVRDLRITPSRRRTDSDEEGSVEASSSTTVPLKSVGLFCLFRGVVSATHDVSSTLYVSSLGTPLRWIFLSSILCCDKVFYKSRLDKKSFCHMSRFLVSSHIFPVFIVLPLVLPYDVSIIFIVLILFVCTPL